MFGTAQHVQFSSQFRRCPQFLSDGCHCMAVCVMSTDVRQGTFLLVPLFGTQGPCVFERCWSSKPSKDIFACVQITPSPLAKSLLKGVKQAACLCLIVVYAYP